MLPTPYSIVDDYGIKYNKSLLNYKKNNACVQFSSVTHSCPTLCDPMNRSTPGLPVHHYLPEFTQTHVHRVSDAIQPYCPLSSPFPPAPNPSQHQSLFQQVNSSHEVAKVLEFGAPKNQVCHCFHCFPRSLRCNTSFCNGCSHGFP